MSEFSHYKGCKYKDPDNCGGCALTVGGEEGPNYAAWPLSYMLAGRAIPKKWTKAFVLEFQSDNKPYVANLMKHLDSHGITIR